jgi:hypothetical protein
MNSGKLAGIGLTAALALAVILPAVQAQAQAARTFVSATGSDSNNCASVVTPCQHFQAAVMATALGGEVVALDPGKYGSFTISQAITIEGQGWAYIAPPNGGNGITINAVSGSVTIRGVALNGNGTTGGTNGIMFNSGGSLTVTNCVVENFVTNGNNPVTGNGILIRPSSGTVDFTVANTTAANNGYAGVQYLPTGGTVNGNGIVDHVVATANQYGIAIDSSGAMLGATVATVSNSIASDNTQTGVFVKNGSATVTVSVDNVSMSGNNVGIAGVNSPQVLLGRSVITGNVTGIFNGTSPNAFYTYKDNRINLNTMVDGANTLNTMLSVQ